MCLTLTEPSRVPPRRLVGWALGLAAGLAPAIATGQEYCVACTGPDAVYRCVIDATSPQGMPLKTLCLTSITRDGQHARCDLKGGTVFDCNGPVRRVGKNRPLPGGDTPSAGTPPAEVNASPRKKATGTAPAEPSNGATAGSPPKTSPRTVEELARQAAASSAEKLRKANEVASEAPRRTWDCIASFFKSC
jgi:hypothetical protein